MCKIRELSIIFNDIRYNIPWLCFIWEVKLKKDIYALHVEITDKVKKILEKHKVVFPAYYGKLFNSIAQKLGVELSPNELFHPEMLDEKIVRHIISLVEYSSEAIEAMKLKDEDKLNCIIEETQILREEIRELQHLVYEDSLTKCFNRKWFEDKYLNEENTKFAKDGILVFVDLNRLKRINDDYGHLVGDKVIAYLAQRLKDLTSNVVRFGGDEFLLICEDNDMDMVQKKLEETYVFFKKTKFKTKSVEFYITFAYGICSFKQGDLLSRVMDKADQRMYRFKEGARST